MPARTVPYPKWNRRRRYAVGQPVQADVRLDSLTYLRVILSAGELRRHSGPEHCLRDAKDRCAWGRGRTATGRDRLGPNTVDDRRTRTFFVRNSRTQFALGLESAG